MRPVTNAERDLNIIAAIEGGKTYRQIAEEFNISRGRVAQIAAAHKEAQDGQSAHATKGQV